MSHGNHGAGVPNLLGEALLGLNLVMLLCRHPADAGWGCPRQRLHLLDGFHGDTLGKHAEEWRHIHDDTLLVGVRHHQIWGAEKCVITTLEATNTVHTREKNDFQQIKSVQFWRFKEGWLRIVVQPSDKSVWDYHTNSTRVCDIRKVSPFEWDRVRRKHDNQLLNWCGVCSWNAIEQQKKYIKQRSGMGECLSCGFMIHEHHTDVWGWRR